MHGRTSLLIVMLWLLSACQSQVPELPPLSVEEEVTEPDAVVIPSEPSVSESRVQFLDLVSQLDAWPEESQCTPDHLSLIDEAKVLDPSSLWVTYLSYQCADTTLEHDRLTKDLAALEKRLSELLATYDGLTPRTAIQLKDIQDIYVIQYFANKRIFDIEVVRVNGVTVYLVHSFDSNTNSYSRTYASISDFFRKEVAELLSANNLEPYADEVLYQTMLIKHLEYAKFPELRATLANGDYDSIIDTYATQAPFSSLDYVLYAKAQLAKGTLAADESVNKEVSDLALDGFVDAQIVLSHSLLLNGDNSEGVYYLEEIVNQLGIKEGLSYWAEQTLVMPQSIELFSAVLDNNDNLIFQEAFEEAVYKLRHVVGDSERLNNQYRTLIEALVTKDLPFAHYAQSLIYRYGEHGQEKDIDKALQHLELAAQKNYTSAILDLGVAYARGTYGLDKDYTKAVEQYQRGAALKDPKAIYNLGRYYRTGTVFKKNSERAKELFLQSLEYGFAPAACELGNLYRYGGPEIDQDKALAFYQQGIENVGENIRHMGSCYYGAGTISARHSGDIEASITYLKEAAGLGLSEANRELGILHEFPRYKLNDIDKARSFYEKAVEKGNAGAAANLGYIYEVGNGVDIDLERAAELYKKSAEGEHPQGMNNLATFYRNGTVFQKDLKKALSLYQKAALKGSDVAANNLGGWYWYGTGGEIDYYLACDYYQQAADSHYSDAYYHSAYCFINQISTYLTLDKAKSLLMKSAEQGNNYSLMELGYLYHSGNWVEKDHEKALSYYQQALDNGFQQAYDYIADLYAAQEDWQQAFKYYQLADENKSTTAYLKLAKLYWNGQGVRKARKKALKLIENTAVNRDIDREVLLADNYYFGSLGEADYENAFKHYQEVSKNNNYPSAINNLGEMYRLGQFVDEDKQQAVKLYEEAYALNSSVAAFNLGQMYRDGEGIEKDRQLSCEWFQKAYEIERQLPAIDMAKCYMDESYDGFNKQQAYDLLLPLSKKANSKAIELLLTLLPEFAPEHRDTWEKRLALLQ